MKTECHRYGINLIVSAALVPENSVLLYPQRGCMSEKI